MGIGTVLVGIIDIAQTSGILFIDIITSVLTVISGYFLYQTGIAAKNILNGKSDESRGANNVFESYSYYLQVMGVFFITGIVAIIFIFIIL